MNTKTTKDLRKVIEKALEENKIQHFDENSSKQLLLQELSVYYRELEFQNDELRTTQYNLEQTRDELSELIENAPVGYVVYNDDFKIVLSNRYFEKLIKVEKNSLKDALLRNFIHPSAQDAFYIHFEKLKRIRETESVELQLLSGTAIKNVKIESTLHVKSDTVLYMTAFTDITDQKQAQAALVESRQSIENIVSNSPIHIWKFDGRVFSFVNSAMRMFLGLQTVSRIDFSLWKYSVHPDDMKAFMALWDAAMFKKNEFDFELRLKNSTGNYRHLWCHVVPILNESNELEYYQGYNVDITERKNIEKELISSEEKYRIIAENTSDGILIIDEKYYTTYSSPVFNKYLRHSESNVANKRQNYFQLIHPADREIIKTAFLYAVSQQKETLIYSYKIISENYDYCWKEDHATFIYDSNGNFTHAFIVSRDISERKKSEAKILEYQKDLKNYAGHLQTINEEERTNLAREIHDEMSQILIALKIEVGILKQEISKNYELASMQKAADAFAKITGMVDNTLKTTLRIISGLRPDVIDILGFVDATKAYLADFGNKNNIETSFSTNIEKIELKPHVELSLFRILQEALINTVRHAKATNIKVDINYDNNNVVMNIFDNGVGFNSEVNKKIQTYGLIGMKERASVLNGHLKIDSNPGFGTLVVVEIPINSH